MISSTSATNSSVLGGTSWLRASQRRKVLVETPSAFAAKLMETTYS
nr:hypothetical protein [Massilia sp. IC2-278]